MAKTEGRGGARKGSGPKPKSRVYSDAIKDELTSKLVQLGAKYKTSWLEQLGLMALGQGENNHANAQLGAMKLVADILVVKESIKTVETLPGVVELPARGADPVNEEAKVTVQ
jgi:hypothetical protein